MLVKSLVVAIFVFAVTAMAVEDDMIDYVMDGYQKILSDGTCALPIAFRT